MGYITNQQSGIKAHKNQASKESKTSKTSSISNTSKTSEKSKVKEGSSVQTIQHSNQNHKLNVCLNFKPSFPPFVAPLLNGTIMIIECDNGCQCDICLKRGDGQLFSAVSFRHIKQDGSTIRLHQTHSVCFYFFSDHEIMIVTDASVLSSDQQQSNYRKYIIEQQTNTQFSTNHRKYSNDQQTNTSQQANHWRHSKNEQKNTVSNYRKQRYDQQTNISQQTNDDWGRSMEKPTKIYIVTLWDLYANTINNCYIAQQEKVTSNFLYYFNQQTELMCLAERIGEKDQWERTKFGYFKIQRSPQFKMIPFKSYDVLNSGGGKHIGTIKINNKSGLLIIKQVQHQIQFVICNSSKATSYTMSRQIKLDRLKDAWEYTNNTLFITYQNDNFLWNYKKEQFPKLSQKLQRSHNVQFIGYLHRSARIRVQQQQLGSQSQEAALEFYPATFIDPQTLDILYQKYQAPQCIKDKFVLVPHYDTTGYIQAKIQFYPDRIKFSFIYIRIHSRRKKAIQASLQSLKSLKSLKRK